MSTESDSRVNDAYPRVSVFDARTESGSVDFPRLERQVLSAWDADETFRASIDQRADAEEFVFYDGPPFANGLPHYGHLLTGYVKDLVPRFQTMRGKKVERRFGWDCHGLPAELEAEKQLGITDKSQIHRPWDWPSSTPTASNRCCATPMSGVTTSPARRGGSISTTTTRPWTSTSWSRSCGRSSRCTDKGLIYQGFRVLPYSWYEQTPLVQSGDPPGRLRTRCVRIPRSRSG